MLELSSEVRGRLLALQHGTGYQDLIDIGVKLCQKAELSLFELDRAHGATAEQVLSGQEQCRAQRIFFQNLLAEIEMQVQALLKSQEGPAARAEEAPESQPVIDLGDAADILGIDEGTA